MPQCSLRDMLESKDGTASWAPIVAQVTKAPQTVKSSPGARGEDWVRATLNISAEGASCELVWTSPVEPYLSNPKLLEGKSILLEQGVTVDTYKGARRIRARGNEVQGAASGAIAPPAPTSAPQGPIQAPAQYLPPNNPAQAHPLMAPAPGLTDRALLQAIAAWAPKLRYAIDPTGNASSESVSACLNTFVIAATQGKIAVTLFSDASEEMGD